MKYKVYFAHKLDMILNYAKQIGYIQVQRTECPFEVRKIPENVPFVTIEAPGFGKTNKQNLLSYRYSNAKELDYLVKNNYKPLNLTETEWGIIINCFK